MQVSPVFDTWLRYNCFSVCSLRKARVSAMLNEYAKRP